VADWFLYVVRCAGGSLYTGVTTDVGRRFAEHASGGPRAAKYLRGRSPLKLAFWAKIGPKSTALSLERRFKGLSRTRKLALISGQQSWTDFQDSP
jgi:putative endonuclease